MPRTKQRGYIETSSLFGWIVFIAIAGTLIYYGKVTYDAYANGYAIGHKDAQAYADSPEGHFHGRMFENALAEYIRTKRDKYKEKNFRDKAFIYGWDSGMHDLVDKILR